MKIMNYMIICQFLDEHHGNHDEINDFQHDSIKMCYICWWIPPWPRFLETSDRGLKKVGIAHLASSAMSLNWDLQMVLLTIKHIKPYIYIITFINALVMILRIHINPSFFYMFQVYKSNFPPVFPWITDGASLMPCCSGCEKLQLHPHLLLCAQAVGLCQSARLFAPGSSTTGERSKLLG